MSEWWTYRLSSFLLYSPRTWLRLLELYNEALWPLPILTLAAGIALLVLSLRDGGWQRRGVAAILAAGWAFVGWAFHYRHYATINWAAPYFAAAFAIEALLLTWVGVIRGRLELRSSPPVLRRTGLAIVVLALFSVPAIGLLPGRPWWQAQFFGVAPDPTAMATVGVLLATKRPFSSLMIIPLLWCVVSSAFQWAMALPDAVLPFVALVVVAFAAVRRVGAFAGKTRPKHAPRPPMR